ncbi:hypothetical protein [Bombiscardovia coagulans]|uniref:Membrane associated protein n=1 Tax=Bombiscardovia coagulans TaxID=686666 RepID=A0A261EVV0_9BIFI|nr:hypothetical protein [Bombiscardovia coagulans]OZG50994.1 hypothetical protein BOCO_0180 [Bombiscardovia coagulans]
MTQHKNSNDDDKLQNEAKSIGDADQTDSQSWQNFMAAHSEDFKDIESSSTAKRFKRKIQRESKTAALTVKDLPQSSFTDSNSRYGRGPRDFTSSWLDTDTIMDQESPFVPPNPSFDKPSASFILYSVLAIIGIIGLVSALFVHPLPTFLGPLAALCTLLGISGLIYSRQDFHQRKDPDDDGARV